MKEALRQMLVGAGSLFAAPAGALPPAQLRITLPPSNLTQALAHDFGMIGGDLRRAIEKIEHAEQIELELKA